MKYILTEKQLNLLLEGHNIKSISPERIFESLKDKIKSRAPEQEKQREEYINQILKGRELKDLTNEELKTILDVKSTKKAKKQFINNLKNDIYDKLKKKLSNVRFSDKNEIEIIKNKRKFYLNFTEDCIGISKFRIFGKISKIESYGEIFYLKPKTYKELLEEIENYLIRENIKLNENLNLKSRAPEQEKQREKYINNIINKPLGNLIPNDFETLEKLDTNKLKEILLKILKELSEFEPEIKKYDMISYNFYKIYFNNIKPKKYKDFSIKKSIWTSNKSAISYDDTYFYFFEYFISNNIKQKQVIATKRYEFKTIKELIKYIKENNEPEI